jgi:hypothetical protein
MALDDQSQIRPCDRAHRAAGVTTLIPDARRGLLSGLIDDGVLLGENEPSVEMAVAAFRTRRAGPTGWMVGRFVAPTSRLEELSSVLIRSMTHGEAPWSIVAVFDGNPASAASKAASFHATMNPAASVDVVHLTATHDGLLTTIRGAAAAAAAIRHGVLPMIALTTRRAVEVGATSAEGRHRSVGIVIDADAMPAAEFASSIQACVRGGVPFTLYSAALTGHTTLDQATGTHRYGAVNLLGASLTSANASDGEAEAALYDTDPTAYSIRFGGLVRRGDPIRSGRPLATDRAPLLSIASSEPGDALAALGRLDSAR